MSPSEYYNPVIFEERIQKVILDRDLDVVRQITLSGGNTLRLLHQPAREEEMPSLLLTAGIHGDEPAGVWAILEFLESGQLQKDVHWWIFPLLNPHGFIRGTRDNAKGIDLNRDFKNVLGEETRFLIEAVQRIESLDLHLSLHEDWEFRHSYLYEINTSDKPSLATPLLAIVDKCTGLVPDQMIDGHEISAPGLICHPPEPDEPEGWPEAIHLVKSRPLLSYTLETGSRLPIEGRVACHRAVITACAQLLAQG